MKQLMKEIVVSDDGSTIIKMRWIPCPTGRPNGNSRQRRKEERRTAWRKSK